MDLLEPEQEYYLQPAGPGRSRNASSMCPVGFSFGGDHLWDRFSVSSLDILFNLIFVYSHFIFFPFEMHIYDLSGFLPSPFVCHAFSCFLFLV